MADENEVWILRRESPKAVGTALRYASRPCRGRGVGRLVAQWRDAHNRALSGGALRREGKVCIYVMHVCMCTSTHST